jgi:osmoprotectant transport system substrate-binding protein
MSAAQTTGLSPPPPPNQTACASQPPRKARGPMRRYLLPTATAVALLMGAAACGSSGSSSSNTTVATTAAPSTSAPAGSTTTSGATTTVAAGGSTTTAAGASGGSSSVVVGSANFPENEILADIYADALKKAGVSATTKLDIGSREVYYKEMQSGAVNVFPEYNGALLDYLQSTNSASSTSAVDTALSGALPSSLEILNPSQAQDNDSITVTQTFATAHNLKSIGDLKAIESQITIGAAPEFATRQVGLVGLKSLYGIVPAHFDPLDESGPLSINALRQGKVQAADIYTTDPSVTQYHFVALADPDHLFPAENVVPLVNKSVANATVTQTLNAVSAALTTSDLVQLVGAVVNDHQDAGTVAAQFVSQANLG